MREDWKYCTFADTYPIIMGKTPARADNLLWDKKKVSHNLWVSISDISNNEGGYIYDTEEYVSDLATLKMRKVLKGSLLMSFKLTIGKMAFAGDDLYTNEAIIAIPEKRKYNLRFLYYYLSGYEWSTLTDGAEKVKGKTLNKASIGRILLPEIPLAEQERIVALLDDQFAKIDQLKANAELQLQAAKDLFQSALKEMLTPQEGCERKMLKEVSTIIGGSTPKTSDASNWGGNNNWVTPAELNGEKYYGKTKRTISDKAAKGMQLLPVGTVLLSSRAPIGKVAITTEPMYCNQGFKNIVCSNVLYNEYVYWYILFSVPQLEALGVGATFKELSKPKTEEFSISFPPLAEQERIAARLDAISEKVKALQANYDQTITLCNDLKQALLKSIFA